MSTVKKMEKIASDILNSEVELVLEQLQAIVYVCDLDNYQILYMNNYARQIYGNGLGKTCWEWFQREGNGVCSYCSNGYLTNEGNEDHIHIRDHFNPFNDKWYEIHDKIINWTGNNKAKLQIAYNIDHRKDDEKKLLMLYKQQELFSKIATSFNSQKAFANKVNEVLGLVGNFVDVSRVSLYKNISEKNKTKLVYEWCKEGVPVKIDRMPEVNYNPSHPAYKLIMDNKLLNANDLNDNEFKKAFAIFRKFDIRAMLLIPIYLHGNHTGFLSFEVCDKIRAWQENEIQLLKTFGNILSTSFERKTIEEKRIRSERNLKHANATKDKFFSIATRDLHTPFSDLTSLSSILLDNYTKWDDEKRLKFLESIKESSKNGFKLLENLIVWSKMQSGQVEFFQQEVDIRSVLSLTIEQLKERAEKKNIKIKGLPEDLLFVSADYLMLNTITRNLINNAIKFTPNDGKIEIKLKEIDGFLEVCICDNGIGIEKKYLNHLFKIDLDNSSFGPSEEKGTGLGLIICQEFVRKNGGQIWAESELGKGSCFKFTVPLVKN